MATEAEYREQARDNRDHAEWLLANGAAIPVVSQWAATATFYSALHVMSAYLLTRGVVATNHAARAKALADPRNGVPQPVFDAYQQPERRNVQARYLHRRFTVVQVRGLIDHQLAEVMRFVKL